MADVVQHELQIELTRQPDRIASFSHHAHAAITVRREEYLEAIQTPQHDLPRAPTTVAAGGDRVGVPAIDGG